MDAQPPVRALARVQGPAILLNRLNCEGAWELVDFSVTITTLRAVNRDETQAVGLSHSFLPVARGD